MSTTTHVTRDNGRRSPDRYVDFMLYAALHSFRFTFQTALHVEHDGERTEQTRAITGLVESGLLLRNVTDLFDEYSDGRPILSLIAVDARTAHLHLWSPTPTPGERELHRGPLVNPDDSTQRAGYFVVYGDDSTAQTRVEIYPPLDLPIGPDGRGL